MTFPGWPVRSGNGWAALGRLKQSHVEKAVRVPIDEFGPYTARWDYPDGRWRADRLRLSVRPAYWRNTGHGMCVPGCGRRPIRVHSSTSRQSLKPIRSFWLKVKCADAIDPVGHRTTAMNRAKRRSTKTNWDPGRSKSVLIWPDRDAPAGTMPKTPPACVACRQCLRGDLVPPSKPEKWDAADAVDEV